MIVNGGNREPEMPNRRPVAYYTKAFVPLNPCCLPSFPLLLSFILCRRSLRSRRPTDDDRGPKAALTSQLYFALSPRKNNERTNGEGKKRKRNGEREREKFHTCAPRVKHAAAAAASAFTVTVTAFVPSMRARDSLGRRGGREARRRTRRLSSRSAGRSVGRPARGRPEFVAAL